MTDSNVFDSLPAYIQRKIDHAFDAVAGKDHDISKKNEKRVPDYGGGGFVTEDAGGGGFINEQKPTQISMTDIPSALQHLDLAPDDERVLAVFRNAATGWSAASSDEIESASGGWVSREDWRAVCAVLLEHYQEEYQDDSDHVPQLHSDNDEFDAGSDDDQYMESQDDNSDDEYIEGHSVPTRRNTRTSASKHQNVSLDSPSATREPTKRQQEVALEAFTLFFPDVSPEDIPQQRIMISDLQRVALLLGEKIKADEVIEMVDAFSTSSDKSISLEDFNRIMIATKLA